MSGVKADLSGRSALITGAGSGHGREIALALSGSGAAVAASDINLERAETTVELIQDNGGAAVAFHADASNRFQASNLIERTRDAFGKLDILVTAAEVYHPEPLLTIDEWNWRRQLEVNVTGAFFCLQLAARVMADEGGGTIINLFAGEALNSTLPAGIGYLASMAGLAAMTRQAARELAQYKIRVNGIAIGKQDDYRCFPPEHATKAKGYDTDIQDLKSAAVYLCSDAAHSVTGQVWTVKASCSC